MPILESRPILKPRLLVVEGQDEVQFFTAFVESLGRSEEIDIREVGGVGRFESALGGLKVMTGFSRVMSLGVVRDSDLDPKGALSSIQGAFSRHGFAVPEEAYDFCEGSPRVGVALLPKADTPGMLEDLCLDTVEHDPAMECVGHFFECLREQIEPCSYPRLEAKARVRAFLTTRELLEENCFTCQQDLAHSCERVIDDASATTQVHAFLATRYKPSLPLGLAAKKGYWDFNHDSLSAIRLFLLEL